MRTKTLCLLLVVAACLAGCPSSPATRDAATPPNDTNPSTPDTGMDGGSTGNDAAVPATPVSLASLVNGSAADHPASGATVSVTGNLVALTPRLFISQSTTTMRCTFAAWVGTQAGGDYSGIEVTDSFVPVAPMDCFTSPAHIIPDTLMIGDGVTTLIGDFSNFCPMSNCPANTAQELDVRMGTFTVGAHVGDPTSTTVAISDVAGVNLEVGTRGAQLQGALVTITGTVIVELPTMTNHNVMAVAATGTTTPIMHIQVSKYSGVTCQRSEIGLMAVGDSVGDITGVLQYSFNQWTLQPRQSSDLPAVLCTMDAGVSPG